MADQHHVPANLNMFRMDLSTARIISMESFHRNGAGPLSDYYPQGRDDIRLVLEPSIVIATPSERGRAHVRTVALSEAIRFETNRGLSDSIAWVRDPNGLWCRLRLL